MANVNDIKFDVNQERWYEPFVNLGWYGQPWSTTSTISNQYG